MVLWRYFFPLQTLNILQRWDTLWTVVLMYHQGAVSQVGVGVNFSKNWILASKLFIIKLSLNQLKYFLKFVIHISDGR